MTQQEFNDWLDNYEPTPLEPITDEDIYILREMVQHHINLLSYGPLLTTDKKTLETLNKLYSKVVQIKTK